ncbi:MAG: sigma-70 family RNA polymerase sigma factor [Clostridia bacterium]|nr:sigma-70 family RNA polymerase sigma factor [Clostridia bacterium]MBQ7107263.1 sigma-70 family RNA polymerase sigma factor [Clostridia bacterium]
MLTKLNSKFHQITNSKKLTANTLKAAVKAYQEGNSYAAERLRQAFAPLVYKLSHRHCVYSVLGEDAENTVWMIFYDFLSKYKGNDFKHLPGLIRRFLIFRLLRTMQKEGKRWDIERCLDEDDTFLETAHQEDLQDVLNNLALAQEINLLPPTQAQVLKDVYFKKSTQEQVACSTNYSARHIRRYKRKALNTLRTKLAS